MSVRKMKLGDVCKTISETYRGKDEAVVLINTSDVLDGKILNHKEVPNRSLKGQFKKTFQKDDILYSEIRPANKRYAYIDVEDTHNYIASTKLMVIRADQKLINPKYLLAILSSPLMLQELQTLAESRSGTFPQITFNTEIAPMEVTIPDREKQDAIVSFIDALNGKIGCNNAINKNFSEQIQAIYCNGYDPLTYEATGVLSDICQYSSEKIPVSDLSAKTYYSTENMQPNKAGSIDATSLPSIQQTTKCHMGDVLISNIRPYFKKIVYVSETCGCSTDVLCFVPKTEEYSAFLFSTLYADRFFDYMVSSSKGTKMPRGDKQQIMNYPVVIPSPESLNHFNEIVLPMLGQIACNRKENTRLTAIRDTLLPKLMSGELDVSKMDL